MTARSKSFLLRWNVGRGVNSVAISHDGLRVASGLDNRGVRIWDIQTGASILSPLKGHTHCVRSLAWSQDDALIVSGSNDATICVWDAHTGASIGEPLKGHAGYVLSVAFSPKGSMLISGSGDKTIRVWDVRTRTPKGEPLRGHTNWVRSAAFSPDSTRIVSCSDDSTIRIWDAGTGAPIGEPLIGHTSFVWSVAFSNDGTRIVSGSVDTSIRMWSARTGAPIGQPLRGHLLLVSSLAFSPDSTRIVSGSHDNTVRMWDACSGAPIGEPLRGHTGYVSSVAISPDGTRIVSGSSDKTICVWEPPLLTSSIATETSNIDNPVFDIVANEINTPLANLLTDGMNMPSFDMVTSKMSIQAMFECLVRHGCSDLTSSADANQSSPVITSGGFGDVRRLVMDNGIVVAIKTLRLHVLLRDDDKAVKRAVREVYIWSRLRHVNVQELLGIIVFQGGLGMVSPWMEQGNLKEYLTANPDVGRYPLCVQLSSGLAYLHSIRMVHGDLKATNILVSQEGTLKINDFDYAILSTGTLQFSTTTRPGGGTLRWMAPELFQPEDDDLEHNNQSESQSLDARTNQTDVYALGMTILEIFTGTVPYFEYKTDVGIYRALHTKTPPKRPKALSGSDDITLRTWMLLLTCWDHDPIARPDALSVLTVLKSLST